MLVTAVARRTGKDPKADSHEGRLDEYSNFLSKAGLPTIWEAGIHTINKLRH